MMKHFIIVITLIVLFGGNLRGQVQADSLYDHLVTIDTDFGKIRLILFDDTPLHKANFLRLAQNGIYDHIYFHRIINNFMIQIGEPRTRNKPIDYDPTVIKQSIPAEIKDHYKHDRGFLGTARRGNDVNPEKRSNGTQFYIVQNISGAHHLDGEYTIFGKVMSGMDVVDKIASVPTDNKGRPMQKVIIVTTVDKVLKKDLAKYYNYPVKH